MDRIRVGGQAHPGALITWLCERGYQAASFGTDGFGDHQGVLFSRSLLDPAVGNEVALIGDTLVWDGTTLTIERAEQAAT